MTAKRIAAATSDAMPQKTVTLNTGLREAKILEIDRTWLRKRDDG